MANRVKMAPWLLLQLAVRRVEGLTLIALLVCLAGASLQWLVLPQIEQRGRALQRSLTDDSVDHQRLDGAALHTGRYRAFRDRLAENGDHSALLKVVFLEATAAGIALPQGDYSRVVEADGGYDKLQITLPVKGTYPQIRAFIRALLEKLPALSLDEISFRRDAIKNTNVEARLRLTLYLKDAG